MISNTRPSPSVQNGLVLLHLTALVMVLVEFSGIWLWLPAEAADALPERFLGGAFRLALWAMMLAVIVSTLAVWGAHYLDRIIRTVGPYLPFYALGLLALAWSIDLTGSLRLMIIWAITAAGIAAIGATLPQRLIIATIRQFFILVAFFSLVVSVAFPAIGTQLHFGDPVFKGLFVHKNTFGWFCTLGILFVLTDKNPFRLSSLLGLALLSAGLVLSGSMTAVLITVIAAVFLLIHRLAYLDRERYPLLMIITGVGLVCAALLGLLVLEPVATFLGRDPTFSGRVLVWAAYLEAYGTNIFLGEGPGTYTWYTERGADIAQATRGFYAGTVGQPHNIYIGLLGEVGIVGVLLFAGAHLYVAFVAPFRASSRWSQLAAAVALAILLRGFSEDVEGYHMSIALFLILLSRSGEIAFKFQKAAALQARALGGADPAPRPGQPASAYRRP